LRFATSSSVGVAQIFMIAKRLLDRAQQRTMVTRSIVCGSTRTVVGYHQRRNMTSVEIGCAGGIEANARLRRTSAFPKPVSEERGRLFKNNRSEGGRSEKITVTSRPQSSDCIEQLEPVTDCSDAKLLQDLVR
jgi:hypothetical protein